MSPNKETQKSIESRLAQLESILEELESGDLELDQALKKFEQGVKLSRECQKTLEDAEIKIKILMDNELKDTDQTLEH